MTPITVAELEARLREAAEVIIRLRIRDPRPAPPRAMSLPIQAEWGDYPDAAASARGSPPEAAAIDRADEAWEWLSWFRTSNVGTPEQRELWVRIIVARAYLYSFEAIADMVSWKHNLTGRRQVSRETVRRNYIYAMTVMAQIIRQRQATAA